MKKEEIEQPARDLQQILSDIMDEEPEVVEIRGKKYRIGWLKNRTIRKFSAIMLKEKDAWKQSVKVCACVLLNRKNGLLVWFLLHFWYWAYWRYLYYLRDLDQVEVLGVLAASKKKIQSTPLALATILATEMADTMMMMAGHERGQAEQHGAQPTQ